MPYCYNFVYEFQKAQNIKRPKKIFKTPIEIYRYNENIYDKELIYPEEVLQAREKRTKKLRKKMKKILKKKLRNNHKNLKILRKKKNLVIRDYMIMIIWN